MNFPHTDNLDPYTHHDKERPDIQTVYRLGPGHQMYIAHFSLCYADLNVTFSVQFLTSSYLYGMSQFIKLDLEILQTADFILIWADDPTCRGDEVRLIQGAVARSCETTRDLQ